MSVLSMTLPPEAGEHCVLYTGGGRAAGAPLSLRLAAIVGDSIVDGPGLRVTLFCQGCPHRCPGCHNPETHPFEGGREWTVEEVLREIRAWPLCRGVTFSGGEPFCQAKALCALADELHRGGYELAAYSGYTFEELQGEGGGFQKELLSKVDVLVDGRYEEAQRNLMLRFRGSENQRILDMPASLGAGQAVWVRESRWLGETGAH